MFKQVDFWVGFTGQKRWMGWLWDQKKSREFQIIAKENPIGNLYI